MKIYNTLTRKVEEFIPWYEGKVGFYTCGPTVYHYSHIGNLRNYIGHDILDKTLRYLGYEVTRVMNITDIGHLSSDSDTGVDKMVKTAQKEGKSISEIADFYTAVFFRDFDWLNCRRPDIVSKATDNIAEYIKIIKKLIKNRFAYVKGGNVYFDTTKLKDYYRLTNHKEDEMVVGARAGVGPDSNKRNQNDFVLWFTKSKFEAQELKWDSPWGFGYPGWHLECSGISLKYLGEYLDIHGGGVDNIFPHHTNEIAQSEAYIGHEWCHYWFHNEHLNTETGKMSKSKGEFLTIEKLKNQGYNPLTFRFLCLTSHYRSQLLFSYQALDGANQAYQKLLTKIKHLDTGGSFAKIEFVKWDTEFKQRLANDLNTANALALLHELLRDQKTSNRTKLKLIEAWDQVLSLDLLKKETPINPQLKIYIESQIQLRNQAKQKKDFATADQIRKELASRGIQLKDTHQGTKYEIR